MSRYTTQINDVLSERSFEIVRHFAAYMYKLQKILFVWRKRIVLWARFDNHIYAPIMCR